MRILKFMIFFLFISCFSDKNENEITSYLEQDLEIHISKDHSLFLILPLTACSSCINATKEFLIEQNQDISNNISIVLLGYEEYSLNSYSENLNNHYPIYYDKTGNGFKKKFLNESLPLVVVFEKGKMSSFNFNINDMDRMKEEVLKF